MAKLTSKQASELASQFLGLAQAIGDFRFARWKKLTRNQNKRLASLQWETLQYGEDILARSTSLVLGETREDLRRIDEITSRIRLDLGKLEDIGKGIKLATGIARLGASILERDPVAIDKAITAFLGALKEK